MLGRLLATSRASFAPPLLFRGLAKQAGGKAGRGQKAQVSHGVAHVHTTYNNTIISVTTAEGDTVLWGSCGTVGLKGARRATYYACYRVRHAQECHWCGVYHRDEPRATDDGGHGSTF